MLKNAVRKLSCREDVRRVARNALQIRQLPEAPLQIDEQPGFYGVRSPRCQMIFARCNGRLVYCRMQTAG